MKTKDSAINSVPLSSCNVLKDFSADKMEKTGLHDFSVNYDCTDVANISDIDKDLTKKHDIKYLDLLKNVY